MFKTNSSPLSKGKPYLQRNPKTVYLEVIPTLVNGACVLATEFRTAALIEMFLLTSVEFWTTA